MEPWRPLTQTRLEQKGFRGMRDVLHPAPGEEDMPMMITNMLPLDPVGGGDLVTRPPWRTMGTAPVPLNGISQLAYNYLRLDGVNDLILIVDGAIYKWSGAAWVVYITGAALTAATITLSGTARCYAANIGGKLVISDGVNTPWMYDGVTATLTKLTACPILYGQPTVYYAKLFGIKSTQRSTIVWSEENDPTIGYEAGGFNNAWELGQTGAEPLQVVLGTNTNLFYWRAHSMGAIRGAVTTDFVNDGTHDGVSATIGSLNPNVLLVDRTIYWVDSIGRPYCLEIGGDIQPLYHQMGRKFEASQSQYAVGWPADGSVSGQAFGDAWSLAKDSTFVSKVQLAYNPLLDLVMIAFPSVFCFNNQGDSGATFAGYDSIQFIACFSHRVKSLQAYWTWPGQGHNLGSFTRYFTCLTDPSTQEVFPFIYNTYGQGVNTRTTFRMTAPVDAANVFNLDDDPVRGYQIAPPQYIIGAPQGETNDITLAFDRLDVTVGARTASVMPTGGRTYEAQLGATLQTSNRQVRNVLTAPLYSGDAAIFPAETAAPYLYREILFTQNSFGFAEEGRWARVLLRLDNSVNQGGAFVSFISGWTLTALARTRAPATNITPP